MTKSHAIVLLCKWQPVYVPAHLLDPHQHHCNQPLFLLSAAAAAAAAVCTGPFSVASKLTGKIAETGIFQWSPLFVGLDFLGAGDGQVCMLTLYVAAPS